MFGSSDLQDVQDDRRIGLLAGAGRFPVVFAETARSQGLSVYGIGVQGIFSDELPDVCDRFNSLPVAKLGRAIRFFKQCHVHRVVLAGKVEKAAFWFQRFHLFNLLPDLRGWKVVLRLCRTNKNDDAFNLILIDELERDRISVESALDYCPELLVKHGFLTRRKPSASQWRDIKFGWEIAKEIGRLDIGQTVIVKDTAVLAIEAIEGTDRAIRRAGELCKRGGFCVVKVAKPHQDMRFDVPAIGMQTIQTIHEAGGRVLAIESGMTILLDEEEVIDLADKFGITIVSLNAEELQLRIVS